MEALLNYCEQVPLWHKVTLIALCFMIFSQLEKIRPVSIFNYKKWNHAGLNLVFLLFNSVINILFGIIMVGVFQWIGKNEIGLLHFFTLPIWVELLIGILLLDFFSQYLAHYLIHQIPWLWNFHTIHHSDSEVDVSTGTRHHPGDFLVREVFALVAIVLGGIPMTYYVFYRLCTIFFTYFTHANILVPSWLDQPLSWIFVTPNIHKFHHHATQPWTDSNFGNVFSFWDRIFGTLIYDDPRKVSFGLDVFDEDGKDQLTVLLKHPFSSSRSLTEG